MAMMMTPPLTRMCMGKVDGGGREGGCEGRSIVGWDGGKSCKNRERFDGRCVHTADMAAKHRKEHARATWTYDRAIPSVLILRHCRSVPASTPPGLGTKCR